MKKLYLLSLLLLAINVARAQDFILKAVSDHFSISQNGQGINVYGNDIKDNQGNYFLKSSGSNSTLSWSKITGTPTTLAGYGITDAASYTASNGITQTSNNFALGGALTGATAINMSGNYINFSNNNLGSLSDLNSKGIILQNNIASTSSVYQDSPPLIFAGSAWHSSPSSSFDSRFALFAKGTSDNNRRAYLSFNTSSDGGATWSNIASLTNAGELTLGQFVSAPYVYGTYNYLTHLYATAASFNDGTGYNWNNGRSVSTAVTQTSSQKAGVLLPQMNTIARNTISGGFLPQYVTVTNGGTGYTSAPTVVFTTAPGGSFFTAAGKAVVQGGKVVQVYVTYEGSGYTSLPTVSFSGGGGSGATATVSNIPAGLTIFNIDSAKYEVYNGSSWKQLSYGSSGGITTIGAFSGGSQVNGASVSGSTITFGPADATNPGMISTGSQTIAGAKTFSGGISVNNSFNAGNQGGSSISVPQSGLDVPVQIDNAVTIGNTNSAQVYLAFEGSTAGQWPWIIQPRSADSIVFRYGNLGSNSILTIKPNNTLWDGLGHQYLTTVGADARYATITGSTFTASNGITKTGNNFALGGALTNYPTDISSTDGFIDSHYTQDDTGIDLVSYLSSNHSNYSDINVSQYFGAELRTTDGTNNAVVETQGPRKIVLDVYDSSMGALGYQGIVIGNQAGGIEVSEDGYHAGMHYREDYSSAGISMSGARWIPDKGYNDAHYSSITPAWSSITGKPTTLSGYGITDAYPLTGNPSGFLTTISGIAASGDLSGTYPNPTVNTVNGITKSYYDPTSSIQTQLNGKQGTLTLTTTGTSGAATLVGSTINIPQYAGTAYSAGTGVNIAGNTVSVDQTFAPSWTGQHTWTNNSASNTLTPYITLKNGTTGLTAAGTTYYSPTLSFVAPVWNGSASSTMEFRAYATSNQVNNYGYYVIANYLGGSFNQNVLQVDAFGNGYTTGSWGVQKTGVGPSTTSDGLMNLNFSTSNSGAPTQNSGVIRYMGSVWNTTTSANNWTEWTDGIRNTSGASPVSKHWWSERTSTNNSGAYTDLMSLDNTGLLNVTKLGFLSAPATSTATSQHLTYNPATSTVEQLNGEVILATVTGINAKTVANTNLYTVPTGKTAVITRVMVRCTAASAITAGPTVNVGDSGNGSASIYASTTLSGLTGTTKAYGFSTSGITSLVAAGSAISFNLTAGATGTSQTVSVDLIGYLQ